MLTSISDSRRDAALGALIGALIGDAAGARLEFLGRTPTSDEVDEALRLPGGGCFRVAPGQITDDGELALSLADGLVDAGGFDIEKIAGRYLAWYQSEPNAALERLPPLAERAVNFG